MKIAVPVDDKYIESTVCRSFGRAPFFLIYDTETKESSFLDNSAAAASGGAGIKAAQNLVDQKVKVLLTPRCGENAAQVLKAADIVIYKIINESIKDNIDALSQKKLQTLDEIHAGFHGHEVK